MASSYDTASSGFKVRQLRSSDAAFLEGAVGTWGLPEPTAIATGPRIFGPAGLVGAGENWILETPVPAADVCWVLISADYMLQLKTGVGMPQVSVMLPQGSASSAASNYGPITGHGATLAQVDTIDSGAFLYDSILTPAVPQMRSMWHPIDPERTIDGWNVLSITKASAGAGFAIDDMKLILDHVRFLGFPLNVWGTGALWLPASQRGS